MNITIKITLAAGALALIGATALTSWPGQDQSPPTPPDVTSARGASNILLAQPFRLAQGYTHWYRKEQPTVDAGYLLVLEVDPELVVPRQLAEPVLYVGDETAERVNHGHPSGRTVVIVPAPRDAEGLPQLDLASSPIWFGSERLPESVGLDIVRAERAAAEAAGVRAFAPERITAALEAGGGLLELEDKTALERQAAEWILRFAPGEEELARNLLVPLSR